MYHNLRTQSLLKLLRPYRKEDKSMPSVVIFFIASLHRSLQHQPTYGSDDALLSLSGLIVDINANSVIWVLKVPT